MISRCPGSCKAGHDYCNGGLQPLVHVLMQGFHTVHHLEAFQQLLRALHVRAFGGSLGALHGMTHHDGFPSVTFCQQTAASMLIFRVELPRRGTSTNHNKEW